MKNKLKNNLLYNTLSYIFSLLTPILTAPYISRAFGPSGVGEYSFTLTIASIFILMGLLGVQNYGSRTISKHQNSKEETSKDFWNISAIQFSLTSIMSILYFLLLNICLKNSTHLILAQTIYIFSNSIDISWFYYGKEKVKPIALRNIFFKILTVCMIYIFVHDQNDIWIYATIISGCNLLNQITLWVSIRKEVDKPTIKNIQIKKHLKPELTLFVPILATSIYKIIDKVMLGIFCDQNEVGFYDYAEKTIGMPTSLITAVCLIIMPHITSLREKQDEQNIEKIASKTIEMATFIAIPISLGIAAISSNFIKLFLGSDFEKSASLIKIMSPLLIIMSITSITTSSALIPYEKDKKYMKIILISTFVNVVLNSILVKKLNSYGICIATLISETIILILQRQYIEKTYIKKAASFLFKGLIMLAAIVPFNFIKISPIITIIIQIMIGVFVYGILNKKYIKKLLKQFKGNMV